MTSEHHLLTHIVREIGRILVVAIFQILLTLGLLVRSTNPMKVQKKIWAPSPPWGGLGGHLHFGPPNHGKLGNVALWAYTSPGPKKFLCILHIPKGLTRKKKKNWARAIFRSTML